MGKADIPVSKELVEHYLACLGLSRQQLVFEATPFRIDDIKNEIKFAKDKEKINTLKKQLAKLEKGDTYSPSIDAINKMMREEKTTLTTYKPVLAALRALTQEAHDDVDNPLTPENLPIPIDLVTKLYESPDANKQISDYPSCFDGIDITKRRMSLFEGYYDLGQAIRMSDKPKTLYTAVGIGLDLVDGNIHLVHAGACLFGGE